MGKVATCKKRDMEFWNLEFWNLKRNNPLLFKEASKGTPRAAGPHGAASPTATISPRRKEYSAGAARPHRAPKQARSACDLCGPRPRLMDQEWIRKRCVYRVMRW